MVRLPGLPLRRGGALTEAELENAVRDLLKLYGLDGYHTHDSRRSQAGYPDWTIVGDGGIMWRELKSELGRVSLAQKRWLGRLWAAGGDAGIWRPADLQSGAIAAQLAAIR